MTGLETALMLAGTAISAVGAIQQGNAANKAAKYNAAVAEGNAAAARRDAAENARRQRRLNRKAAGTLRNRDFVAMDVLEDEVKEGELKALDLLHGGEVQAAGFQNNATLERMRGKAAQKAGYMNAAGTLLSGGAKAAGGFSSGASYAPGSSAGSVNYSQGIGLRDSSGFIG